MKPLNSNLEGYEKKNQRVSSELISDANRTFCRSPFLKLLKSFLTAYSRNKLPRSPDSVRLPARMEMFALMLFKKEAEKTEPKREMKFRIETEI